jgi:hypothetical protein
MLLHGGQFENIRNYTQYFFTCKECTTNFLTATQDYESQKQLSVDKVVIYFWKIHNGVNARLKVVIFILNHIFYFVLSQL